MLNSLQILYLPNLVETLAIWEMSLNEKIFLFMTHVWYETNTRLSGRGVGHLIFITSKKVNKNNNLNKLKNSMGSCLCYPNCSAVLWLTTPRVDLATRRLGFASSTSFETKAVKKRDIPIGISPVGDILRQSTNLLEQFYQWFVGISDGESSFVIAKKSSTPRLDKTKFTFFCIACRWF